jgi:hypothetical protein
MLILQMNIIEKQFPKKVNDKNLMKISVKTYVLKINKYLIFI